MAAEIYTLEGNIGAGKTSLLARLKDVCFSKPHVILFEPVDEWMNFRIEGATKSLFELFYEDRKKYAFAFQMMALQSRFEALRQMITMNDGKIVICERSFLTDCEVFAKLNHEEGNISDVEFDVYKKWHSFLMEVLNPNIKGLVYLQVKPEVCKARIIKRNRKGEEEFSDEYLSKLHNYHETWLTSQTFAPSIYIDGNNIPDIDAIINFINHPKFGG